VSTKHTGTHLYYVQQNEIVKYKHEEEEILEHYKKNGLLNVQDFKQRPLQKHSANLQIHVTTQ